MNDKDFMSRLKYIKDQLDSDNPTEIINSLQEKGVECAILVPLLEVILGFDPIRDIRYEYSSTEKYDRFDFLIEDIMIVEAKKLNAKLSSISGQIQKYIHGHSNINYGILSNGLEFSVFMQKDFVKKHLSPDEKLLIDLGSNVLHVLSITVRDNAFWDAIQLFNKDQYKQTMSSIARFALTRINQTKATKICDDKNLNLWLQEQISETIDIKPGVYIKDIQENKLQPGDLLVYENECVKIPVLVEKDGRVKLQKGTVEITNMKVAMENRFSRTIELVMKDWKHEDVICNDPLDIIKMAIGQEKLFSKSQYVFKKV